MIRLLTLLITSGSSFAMCDGGPVPVGCCEPGDRLDVVVGVDGQTRCDDMGGTLDGVVCIGVDF